MEIYNNIFSGTLLIMQKELRQNIDIKNISKNNFLKPILNDEQISRLKKLNSKDNFHGFISIFMDFAWIIIAICLSYISPFLYPLTILIIGSRQRALASLLHEAAHTTLFKSRILNISIGRILCGWTILQSFGTYRITHALNHHPRIGDNSIDPDLVYMLEQGVYETQSRSNFLKKFFIKPLLGSNIPYYIRYLIKDRFISAFKSDKERPEATMIIIFHLSIIAIAFTTGLLKELVLFWWIPFLVIHPIIGWFSELSEHYPMMEITKSPTFYSRNRYAGWTERFFIGMHADYLHLTHHLYPAIPHWNLKKATEILREDPAFRDWDDYWGGIFSSCTSNRTSLLKYILNNRRFSSSKQNGLEYAQ